jgi:hypothetical protein
MGIKTIQTGEIQTDEQQLSGGIDVSDVKTRAVTEFADDREVFFKRRGGRTYLITTR